MSASAPASVVGLVPVVAPPRFWRWMRVCGRFTALLVLAGLVVLGLLVAIATGSSGLPLGEVVTALGRYALLETPDATAVDIIVWNVRLPRALLGALVGANMAVAGVLLQAIMRNPLASPNILGVTAGAGLFATLAILVVPMMPALPLVGEIPAESALTLPAMAFFGALGTTLLVYGMSWQPGVGTSPVRMILAGVAVTAMIGGAQSFLSVYFADRIQGVILWLAGSLNTRSWQHLPLIWPFSFGGLLLALLLAGPMNLLQLGEDSARSMGLNIQRARVLAIVAAALLTASAVCVAGTIGFIGLVVPHILRTAISHNHRLLIPAAILGGAALLLWADVLARQLGEMPVGVLTAMIGGPYFVFLLYRKKLI